MRSAVALFGVYWDDAWHTDRGRDDLLSAPHVALYLGVLVAVAVVVWWGWLQRAARVRHQRACRLPVLAVGLSAASLTVQVAFGQRVRWPAAWAGAAYSVAMVAVIVALWPPT